MNVMVNMPEKKASHGLMLASHHVEAVPVVPKAAILAIPPTVSFIVVSV